jgi:GNAT superfamily N-acetyltransferase
MRHPEPSSIVPELFRVTEPLDGEWLTMTFPVYRHLLSMQPQTRHPEQGDERAVQPVAIAATIGEEPAGLLLAEVSLDGEDGGRSPRDPEMLSLYVKPEARGQGIATALVERLEDCLRREGHSRVRVVYMTGKPAIEWVERILRRRGWSEPATRSITVRFTPEQALETPWFGKARPLGGEYEVFPWQELTTEERARLILSQKLAPWIAKGLEPWKHDAHGFCEISSLGVRHEGEVVGWVVNHRVSFDTVRFTCSFVRKGLLRRQGRSMPLFRTSIERLRDSGSCRYCTFITPVQYGTMVSFIQRRCSSWVSYTGESRGATKLLSS